MCQNDNRHTLDTLEGELEAWKIHIHTLGLDDRKRFVAWLGNVLEAEEFALIIDCEMDRRELWEIYLCERYGP